MTYKMEVPAMTAVIYARYSSDNQREESIEGQIRECTAYAEKNGITIVKHYIDRAISAKTDNRPEFQQMIKDSDKKLFDIVLVWKLDRFARNRYDSARYKTQLKKNGVKLMSATEIISEGPEGIILESVLEGYAEYYSADLSEKVIRGMTENALKGSSAAKGSPLLPGPLTRAANGCSASTTRKRNSTTRRKNSSMPKSCCRPMRRPDMQTGQRSGTPWKPWRTSGTPSLPGASCWRSRWRCRKSSICP